MGRQRALIALAAALVPAVATGLAAAGAGAGQEGAVHACAHEKHGLLRVVGEQGLCREHERPLSWSVRGPQGDPGPPGRLSSLDELAGLDCTTAAGAAGEVELATAPDGVVTLRCLGAGGGPVPMPNLVINEVDYDQPGADHDGFVEIFNAGDAEAVLDGIAIVLVNGGDSGEYRRRALAGTLAAGGYLVWDTDPQNGSPDGVALVDTASGVLLDALSYEGAITDALIAGETFDLVEGTVLPPDVADSNAVDGSLSRLPNGRDTDDAASDWAFTTAVTRAGENAPAP
jgi:hypothetical protein